MRIFAVAHNTFRETVRDKVLYVLLFFAGVTVFGSKALGWISVGQDIKIVKDISLAAISVFGALIAIFVGASLVYKEIDKRTIYTIISRPMHRFEFVVGKYLGLMGLIALVTLVMGLVAGAYVLLLGGTIDVVFVTAVVLIFWELLVVTALAVLMSTVTSPILGAIIVFSLYVAGHASGILVDLPPHFENTWTETIMHVLYYIIPNLSNFNIRPEAANGVPVSMAYVGWAIVYGTVYAGMLLGVAAAAFEDKDV
ncbi:MAG TPA: ABC transporter permease [Candidatus Hydrogenedentes bacterium]|nr:ABC transporter permease [Candidatus Hydrogenedentota bacterium]HOL78110.1 ABC transporter permease [Candidatus Hydrogenedentota bacterium]HPO86479.1 ABC transporter permease [Candidatus Hydrogenedentota bacterium]